MPLLLKPININRTIIKKPNPITIVVPSNFNFSSIPIFIESIEKLWGNKGQTVEIDLRNVEFITPIGITMLTSFCLYARRNGLISKGIILSPKRQAVRDYLMRMNFYKTFNVELESLWKRVSGSGRFIEIKQINSEDDCSDAAVDIVEIFKKRGEVSDDLVSTLHYCFTEMIDNVFHHSVSPINAIICAQSFPSDNSLEIAVTDCGIGFRESLIKNTALASKIKDDLEAVQYALKKDITSTPNRNTGQGLFFIKEFIEKNKGEMTIYSGECFYHIGNCTKINKWQGASVCLRFNLDQPIDIVKIFNKYYPEDKEI